MTTGALSYFLIGAKVLLGKPTAGPARWNGLGGVVSFGEGSANVLQKVWSRLGITAEVPAPLGGVLYHHPVHGNWKVAVYRIDTFTGPPSSTPELTVDWFPVDQLPYKTMWSGDQHWLPYVISGQAFQAELWFNERDEVIKKDIQSLH